MELKIIRGTNNVGRDLLEISTSQSKIVIGFGEDIATGEIAEKINPMIEGLTTGEPLYDAVFIMRNPENCNIFKYTLKEIPIYLERKEKLCYQISADFRELGSKENIFDIYDTKTLKLKDLEITPFIVDSSNFNTYLLFIKSEDKTILVSGDFKNYEIAFEKEKLEICESIINHVDYMFIEGKYLGKYGLEYSSGKDILDKLKNIMKFYKQVFVIQSETDLITATNMYLAAQKTKKIFIENTFLCNLTTNTNGSAPTPITSKKVYSYNPLILENENFDFRKKYVTPFYINNANSKMQKEKYVINVTKSMLQDIQVFNKEGSIYDACIIMAMWKGFVKQDKELEEFINLLKDMDMDYYELYTHGRVNMEVIKKMILRLRPKNIIPLDFNPNENSGSEIYNFRYLNRNEILEV